MSSDDQVLALLASVPPFDRCGDEELRHVAATTRIVELPAGTVLMRQGEPGSEMMIVIDGSVAVERNESLIAERGPGEVIGEMALLSGMPRTATVTLLEDSQFLVVARPEFDVLMAGMPSFRAQILESLALRARAL